MAIDTRAVGTGTRTSTATPGLQLSNLFGPRVRARDRKFFTEQLALLLESGTPLLASLQALRKQLENPAMAAVVDDLIHDIGQGAQLSVALSKHPEVFSTTYINLVGASEDGGFMHEVLEQLLALDEKREALRQSLVSAMSYPAFLLVFALAVVVFVLVVVFPKFADLFSQIEDQLPMTTVFLMSTSEILQQHWIAILAGIVGGFFLLRIWASTASGKRKLDWARLNLPLIRHVYTQLYLVNTMRVLSLSLGNGVGIMDSLHSCKFVVSNSLFQQFIGEVEDQVQSGKGIAVGFVGKRFIPPIVEQMIATGEETGSLPRVLSRLADYFEGELSNRLNTLSKMAEPVMLLIMGGVVGIIVSSLILPIFKLTRVVG